jgi:tetratricopeptide (TPR) repeat protein
LEEALNVYGETIEQFPNDAVAQSGRAYEKITERFPHDLVARNGYANLLVLTDRFQKARSLLPIENPISKEDWIGYHILAMSYLKAGHTDEAIRRLTYGLEKSRWNKDYFATALGVAKMRKKEFPDVIEILEDGIDGLPISQQRSRLLFLGHVLAEMDRKDDTINLLNSFILINAPSPRVHRLKDYLFQRYALGDARLSSKTNIEVFDREIEAEEFYFAMAT